MPDNELDFWRQIDIFSPEDFNSRRKVHVIGVGAVGSYIALTLSKMGVRRITVYDRDTVAPYNPPNQVYGINDVLENEEQRIKKVRALAAHIKECTGIEIQTVDQNVWDQNWSFQGVVFICVDSMAARKKIYETYLKLNLKVDLLVEIRMGAEVGKIYTIKPFYLPDCEEYEKTFHSDEEAAEDSCTAHAIATTVEVVAGMACHQLTKFQRGISWQKEIIISLNPTFITARSW